jgi:tetratricopeptide (TPR) repeat protein
MGIPQVFEPAINWPSPTGLVATLAVAMVLIVMAAVFLARGKRRKLGYGLGGIGLVSLVAALFVVHAQTTREDQGEGVTVTRPRFSERTRSVALVALFALPAIGAAMAFGLWTADRRRRRRQVPGHLKAGRLHYVQKEYEAALGAYSRAIQSAPYLAEAYCGRGCVYQAMGQTALALADLDQAIRSDPRLASAYIQRAKLRTESGELDAALADLGQVLAIQPSDPELYLNRGICLVKKGQFNEAMTDFHRVLKLTNHSDYAEPAKKYLEELEGRSQPPRSATGGNGEPAPSLMPQSKPGDYVV